MGNSTDWPADRALTDADFLRLVHVRTTLRRLERWGEEQAGAQGLTPAWHELLLAVRGHPGADGPMVGDVAEALSIRPHTAVELCNRAQRAGFIARRRDAQDARVVRLALTDQGRAALDALEELHAEQLRRLGPVLDGAFESHD